MIQQFSIGQNENIYLFRLCYHSLRFSHRVRQPHQFNRIQIVLMINISGKMWKNPTGLILLQGLHHFDIFRHLRMPTTVFWNKIKIISFTLFSLIEQDYPGELPKWDSKDKLPYVPQNIEFGIQINTNKWNNWFFSNKNGPKSNWFGLRNHKENLQCIWHWNE